MPPKSKFKFSLAGNYFTKWPKSTKQIQESVGSKLLLIETDLVKGVNDVTRLLEKDELAFVAICNVRRYSVMLQHLPYICYRFSTPCIAFLDYCIPWEYEVVGFEKSKLDGNIIANEIVSIIKESVAQPESPLILSSNVKYTPVELVAKVRGDSTL